MSNFGLIREGTSRAVLRAIPIPKLRDDYILVKPVIVALNPTDWTSLDAVGKDGVLNGVDYAGIVEEVGSKVTRFRKGDRVAGCSHGSNEADPETGSFAQWIIAKGDIQMHIPENTTFEQAAASCGSGSISAGLALYKYLDLPLPEAERDPDKTILVYGGSTATGSVMIQFAKLSGWTVVATCSPKHFDMLRERGVDAVYDYRDPTVGEKIRKDTGGKINVVVDAVAIDSSAAICAQAIGPGGGVYLSLLGTECSRPDVKSIFFLAYGCSGEAYICEGEHFPADPSMFDFMVSFAPISERLLKEGKWKTHPTRLRPGGLIGVLDGMQEMREGRGPSGEKWIYRVDDTVWPS